MILIDAHSKWIEAFCVASVTSATTMDCLHQGFEQFVIPEIVAMGNGTCFTSKEFKFTPGANGIRRVTLVPYYPAFN